MIRSIRHRSLQRFHLKGDSRGFRPDMVGRIRRILSILDTAERVEDVNMLPGMRLHPLKGDLAGYWSVSVSGNLRIIFQFVDGDALDIDLLDYH